MFFHRHSSSRLCLASLALSFVYLLATCQAVDETTRIGYTELRTNLSGGRHANTSSSRAIIAHLDGSGRQELAAHLATPEDTWTQFAGWSPDGATAIIGNGWQHPENAKWEEQHRAFRMDAGKWRYDSWLLDINSGNLSNVTEIERVSHYNAVSFSPDGKKLLMTSLIDGTSKPYTMELDGSRKTDVSGGTHGFTYGFQASPDGRRICYHADYQIYLANADGSGKQQINTGNPFNFAPTWSPDGNWLLFVSGEHYDCHPYVVRADASGLRKLADRAGYRGVTEFLDVPDFHGGSSDTPVWSADGQSIFCTAKVGSCVELFQVTLDGTRERLTFSNQDTTHYHPKPSPDGHWLLYGSKRDGVRNIYVRDLGSGVEQQISHLSAGHAAMWPHWQPCPAKDQPPFELWSSPAELRAKKLVGTGQYTLQLDSFGVTPAFLEQHPTFSRTHPFDGIVVLAPLDRRWTATSGLELETKYCLDELAWTSKAVPYEALSETVSSLKRIAWGTMTDNFLWYRMLDGSDHKFAADFTNDAEWAVVEANAVVAARLCREAGLVGFMLDTEQYTRYTPNDGEEVGGPFPMGRDAQEILRKRGKQWIRAVQAEFPAIVIDVFFAWSPDLNAADFLKGIGPFLDGVLSGIEFPARIVHGYENTFYYGHRAGSRYTEDGFPGGRARYQGARDSIKAWRELSCDPEKYDRFVEVGMAAWLESDPWNLWPGWPQGTKDSIWSNLPLALAYTQEYVWCWSEHTHYGHTVGAEHLNPFLASLTNQTFNTGDEAVANVEEDFDTDPLERGWYFDFDMLQCAVKRSPDHVMPTPSTDSLPYTWSAESKGLHIRSAKSAGRQRRRFVRPVKVLTQRDRFHAEFEIQIGQFSSHPSTPITIGLFSHDAPLRTQGMLVQFASPDSMRLTINGQVKMSEPIAAALSQGDWYRVLLDYDPQMRQVRVTLNQGNQVLSTIVWEVPNRLHLDELGVAIPESAFDSTGEFHIRRAVLLRH